MLVQESSTPRPNNFKKLSCSNTQSATNGAHHRSTTHSSVQEGPSQEPATSVLTSFHKRYDRAPMKTSDIERDRWLCQEEELIDVNSLPPISNVRCSELSISLLNRAVKVQHTTIIHGL
ncbi:hypothetical protein DSO57_1029400 [Entomophthora muscae]|uniref:Uncharacterized protein n=1 Tax=Entomophthora muscae TaxID=34485 RepID=A0ACC2SE77_9FUNG|nr:hypothetical protein DSO57_1029400 [Entomophthora muscae]